MPQERQGVVTFKGNPLTLVGPEITVGDEAPQFTVLAQDLSPVALSDSQGRIRLISVVPSLDTGVCEQQTRRFNEEASKLPGNVEVLTISADLPFAQKRFCSTAGIDRMKVLSDHKDLAFGDAYGIHMKELRLLARSVWIVDASDTVRYVDVVREMTNHPNYEAALTAISSM